MKKSLVILILVVAALAVTATGVALAQAPEPPVPGGRGPMMGGMARGTGEGPLHDYMVDAMAAALGVSPTDLEARQAAGKTPYQIALDLGISADKVPSLLAAARAKALDAAVSAGAITQQQADWMKSRGGQMGAGNCLGTRQGAAGGMHGWRWQQPTP